MTQSVPLHQDTKRAAKELVNGKSHATAWAELERYNLTQGVDNVACPCCGVIWVSFAVLRRFKWVRDMVFKITGHGVTATSGYRCHASQVRIWENAPQWERDAGIVAHPGDSPHEYGEALDLGLPEGFKNAIAWGNGIIKACAGDIRVGCLKYKGFAHMDTIFLVHPAKGKGIQW